MSRIAPQDYPLRDGSTARMRSAEPDDAARILEVCRAVLLEGAYQFIRAEEFTRTEAEQRQRIAAFAEAPGRFILVAEADGAIVGLLECESDARERLSHRATAWSSILAGYREKGVGKAMAEAGLVWAIHDPKIEKLRMEVLASNARSLALCRSMGFEEEARLAREAKLGPGEYVDVVILSRFVK